MNGGWNKRSIIAAKKREIREKQEEIRILEQLKTNMLYEYKPSNSQCYYIVIPEFNNLEEISYIVLAATASLMGKSFYHFTTKVYNDYKTYFCMKALIRNFKRNLRAVKKDELLLLVGLPYKTPIFEALFKSTEGKIKLED